MAAKPQKVPTIDWSEFDRLLQAEAPGPEWVSSKDLAVRYGRKLNGAFFIKLQKTLEAKKFLVGGKWTSYYRIKK